MRKSSCSCSRTSLQPSVSVPKTFVHGGCCLSCGSELAYMLTLPYMLDVMWPGGEGNLVFWMVFFRLKHVIVHLKHVIISSLAFPIVVLKRGHNSQGCGIIATSAWLPNNNLAAGGRTNIRGLLDHSCLHT